MRHAFPGSGGGQFRGRELTLEAVGRTFCPDPRPGTRRPLRIPDHFVSLSALNFLQPALFSLFFKKVGMQLAHFDVREGAFV